MSEHKHKHKDGVSLGVKIPPALHTYSSLYSLCFRRSKSRLLRELLTQWMEQTVQEYPEQRLIDMAIQKYQKKWVVEKANLKMTMDTRNQISLGFEFFKNTIKAELQKRRIDSQIIHKILHAIKY